jgi:hypothetical protein
MITGIFTCFDHVFMKVLNCGYICQVVVIPKYIYLGMYIWRVLVYCFHCVLYISLVAMGCKESFCRYTNSATCSPTRYVN